MSPPGVFTVRSHNDLCPPQLSTETMFVGNVRPRDVSWWWFGRKDLTSPRRQVRGFIPFPRKSKQVMSLHEEHSLADFVFCFFLNQESSSVEAEWVSRGRQNLLEGSSSLSVESFSVKDPEIKTLAKRRLTFSYVLVERSVSPGLFSTAVLVRHSDILHST